MSHRSILPVVAVLVALTAPAALADIAPSPPPRPSPTSDVAPPPPADTIEVLPAPAAPVLADIPPIDPEPEEKGEKADLVWPIVGGSAAVLLGVGLFFGVRRRKNGEG